MQNFEQKKCKNDKIINKIFCLGGKLEKIGAKNEEKSHQKSKIARKKIHRKKQKKCIFFLPKLKTTKKKAKEVFAPPTKHPHFPRCGNFALDHTFALFGICAIWYFLRYNLVLTKSCGAQEMVEGLIERMLQRKKIGKPFHFKKMNFQKI